MAPPKSPPGKNHNKKRRRCVARPVPATPPRRRPAFFVVLRNGVVDSVHSAADPVTYRRLLVLVNEFYRHDAGVSIVEDHPGVDPRPVASPRLGDGVA